jgi:hypothetical protein
MLRGISRRGVLATVLGTTCVLTAAHGDALPPSESRNEVGGLGCRQTSTTGIYGVFGGTVYNDSTTGSLGLLCPIDMGYSLNERAVGFGSFMGGFDRNPSASVSCTLTGEFLASGGLFQSFSTTSSGAAFNDPTPFLAAFPATVDGWYFYATCTLPPKTASGVSHIAVFNIHKT